MSSPRDRQRPLIRWLPVRAMPPVTALFVAVGVLLMTGDAGFRESELLSRERAIYKLTQRGATVVESVYSAAPDSVLVSFPLGATDRRAAREGYLPFRCGISIRRYNEPAFDGPPMTDADLDVLLDIPDLRRVDLSGTAVSDAAIGSLRGALRGVEVERNKRRDAPGSLE